MSHNELTLSIIGCGHVGSALGRLWHTNRVLKIQQILNRSKASSQQAAEFIGGGEAISSFEQLRSADLYMIGVPDDYIVNCAETLAQTGLLTPSSIVFHCSGSLPSSAMRAASEAGASLASIHPIRSFAVPEQVIESFSGTWCGMEGNAFALTSLTKLFNALDAKLVPINGEAKLLYHSAAVFASNYFVTLLDTAVHAYMQAGIPQAQALQMIEPLVRKTADNVFAAGCRAALSGPIARGDMDLVMRQAKAVHEWNEEAGELYDVLAKLTINIARRND